MLAFAADAEITAVPTYVIDGKWAIPGAQDASTFVNVIRRLLEQRREDIDVMLNEISFFETQCRKHEKMDVCKACADILASARQ